MKENQKCGNCPFEGVVKKLVDKVSKSIEKWELDREYETKLGMLRKKGNALVAQCEEFAYNVPSDREGRRQKVFALEKAAIELADIYRWLDNYRAQKGGAR